MEAKTLKPEEEFLNRVQIALVDMESSFEPLYLPPEGATYIGRADLYLIRLIQLIQKKEEAATKVFKECKKREEMQDNQVARERAYGPHRKIAAQINLL